ncbi:MAG: Ig-like domain-containing protein, partial [Spirochaetota bacterium]
MKKTAIALLCVFSFLLACQNTIAPSKKEAGPTLTVTWSVPGASAKTILPASYPKPSTYDVTLHPAQGVDIAQTGLTATSWTFSNFAAVAYTVSIVGKDDSGKTLVSGSGTADMSSAVSLSVPIALAYINAGSGTGKIHLTLDFSLAGIAGSTSASLTMVDPAGTISTPTPTASGANYAYADTSAAVGIYQMFFTVQAGSQTAMKTETVTVFQNVDTVGTLSFSAEDFKATYVAVTSFSLDRTAETAKYTGQTDTLMATLSAGASNSLITWSSGKTDVAEVNQSGLVTIKKEGSAVITATPVDKPSLAATCTYTVPAVTVSVDPKTVSLMAGGATVTISPTVTNAVDTSVNWSTSDGTIATVVNGVVSAKMVGNATITATSVADPTKSDICTAAVVIVPPELVNVAGG